MILGWMPGISIVSQYDAVLSGSEQPLLNSLSFKMTVESIINAQIAPFRHNMRFENPYQERKQADSVYTSIAPTSLSSQK